MKRYRVMYRANESANDMSMRSEEVYADGWRVDIDKAIFYQLAAAGAEGETPVFDIPKTRVMRIQELSG